MRAPYTFVPQMTEAEAIELSRRYAEDLERAASEQAVIAAGARLRDTQGARSDFEEIVRWKTQGRRKSLTEENTSAEIADAVALALSAKTHRAAMAVLMGLRGVGAPVASALLAMMNPACHTIIDFRALEALACGPEHRTLECYLSYRVFCIELADEWRMCLRHLDRALWLWSKETFG